MTIESRNADACVYLVEDNELMREALIDYMEGFLGYEVRGTAETAEKALDQLDSSGVDIVLVDTSLPGIDGIEFVRRLLKQWPQLRCIMLSGHGERIYVERALEAGARGYVLKGSPDEIAEAVQMVLGGDTYLSASLKNQS